MSVATARYCNVGSLGCHSEVRQPWYLARRKNIANVLSNSLSNTQVSLATTKGLAFHVTLMSVPMVLHFIACILGCHIDVSRSP